ncbi:hypothetical protein FHS16_003818 [Paenibacillus endophyticus]|uniref:Uncharacterized protein n=1 Tax=Paenibacillus endophyticus TaxID=1294268 RepID=A0A7W5GBT1_9BACL|nr:hypothetical protein [Paenibacillus endophyticus]MBB3153743.1 hypothetical protein [Paenibacillus endophyticus]
MKQGMCLFLLIITCMLAIVSCSSKSTFGEELENNYEVLIKGEKFEEQLTNEDKISGLVEVLNNSIAIDTPEKAKGIKPEVAKGTVMIHFSKADFFYIGDGYLYHGNDGQYYSVSRDIEKYTTEQ